MARGFGRKSVLYNLLLLNMFYHLNLLRLLSGLKRLVMQRASLGSGIFLAKAKLIIQMPGALDFGQSIRGLMLMLEVVA